MVNVSAWDDRDKEGGYYKDYFVNAASYSYTNYTGHRGFQGKGNEFFLDLAGDVPKDLKGRFDVTFNHTTLEHIFEVRKAFRNICELSKDVVIVIVPFSQAEHGGLNSYNDYWRFTPDCLRLLFKENGLEVIYEAESRAKNAAIYLLFVGSRHPEKWKHLMLMYRPIKEAGKSIGYSLLSAAAKFFGKFKKV